MPPTNAPGRLVIPPITAAVNAGIKVCVVMTPGAKAPPAGKEAAKPAAAKGAPAKK